MRAGAGLTLLAGACLLWADANRLDRVTPRELLQAQKAQKAAGTDAQRRELKLKKAARKVDTVVVKGTVLQGRITELTSRYVTFSLVYGTGNIKIDYRNIEQLTTEHEYHIFYNGKETTGRIVGIKDHTFLIVSHGKIKEFVKIANIDRFVISVGEVDTLENRLRNLFPYTRGSLDVGIETETGVKRKRKIALSYRAERKKGRHRQILDLHYAYETTTTATTEGDRKSLDKKELVLFAEEDYLLASPHFLFLQVGYELDQPRSVRYRIYPAAGYGYRYRFGETAWLQCKIGGGYVYESFYDYTPPAGEVAMDRNDYGAAFLGVSAKDHLKRLWLINEAILTGSIFYMPAWGHPERDWLSRLRLAVEFPLNAMVSLKWVYRVVNDDNPVPEVGNNKTTTDIYISVKY